MERFKYVMDKKQFEQRLSEVCKWKWVSLPEAPSNRTKQIRITAINTPCEFGNSKRPCHWDIRAVPTPVNRQPVVTRKCTTCKAFLTHENVLITTDNITVRTYAHSTIEYSIGQPQTWRICSERITKR